MTNNDNLPGQGGEPGLPPSKFGVGYTSGEPAAGGTPTSPRIASGNPAPAAAVPPSYPTNAGDPVPAAVPPPYVPDVTVPSAPPAAPESDLSYPGLPLAYTPPAVSQPAPQPGSPVPGSPYPGGYYPYAAGPPPGNSGLAIASLITSIVGFFLTWVGFGWLISIVGIVLGFIALNQIKKTGQSGRGLAIAGIVIGFAITMLGIILAVVLVGSLGLLAI